MASGVQTDTVRRQNEAQEHTFLQSDVRSSFECCACSRVEVLSSEKLWTSDSRESDEVTTGRDSNLSRCVRARAGCLDRGASSRADQSRPLDLTNERHAVRLKVA